MASQIGWEKIVTEKDSTLPMFSGFECEFIEQPQEIQTDCPICLQILREPHQVTCCGKSYCKDCIDQIKEDHLACPTCNQKGFVEFPNKGLQQSLYSFKVSCTHKEKRCDWTGELGQLEKHLNVNYSKVENQLDGCDYVELGCLYFVAGCEKKLNRKEMRKHLEENLVLHTSMLAASNAKFLTTISQLQTENRTLRSHLKHVQGQNEQLQREMRTLKQSIHVRGPTTSGPVEFTMVNYHHLKRTGKNWISPPFYTHAQGYKFCLDVAPKGHGFGQGAYLSVYVHLMRGEFDEELEWPFRGSITFQLCSQTEDENHRNKLIPFNGDRDDSSRVIGKTACDIGRGVSTFISHDELKKRYLRNDCLIFRIVKTVSEYI